VRGNPLDKRRRKLDNLSIGKKKIDGVVACKMTPFEKDCSSKFSLQFFPRMIDRLAILDFCSKQPLCFIKVWCN